jgi:tetratricopeptide (TPR) repeat protein
MVSIENPGKEIGILMKRTRYLTGLIFCSCIASFAQTAPTAVAETLLIRQQYSAARTVLKEFLKTNPEDNKALYLLHAIEQTEILDYESYLLKNESFMRMSDSVSARLEERLPCLSGEDSLKCLFYIANVYGGKGVLLAKTGNWFAALKDAMTSVTLLKEVLQIDSTMIAANLGIGVFHYYLSKSFTWLPFVDANSQKEGIRAIEKATCAPYPYCFAAKNSLCWILIENRDFKRADSIAASVLVDMPDYTIFLRIRCLLSVWNGKYLQAVTLGAQLARLSEKRVPVNWSDLVLAYYTIAQGNDGLGKGKEAMEAVNVIRSKKIPREIKTIPPIKKNFRKISAIRKKYQPDDGKQGTEP